MQSWYMQLVLKYHWIKIHPHVCQWARSMSVTCNKICKVQRKDVSEKKVCWLALDRIVDEDVRQRLAILCQSPTLSESATTAVLDKRIKLCSRWSLWAGGQTNLVTTALYALLKFSSKMKTRIFPKTCVLLWPGPDNAGWETLQKVLCSFTDLAMHDNLFTFSKSPRSKSDWCGSKCWQVSPISCGQQSSSIWEGGGQICPLCWGHFLPTQIQYNTNTNTFYSHKYRTGRQGCLQLTVMVKPNFHSCNVKKRHLRWM